MTIEQVLTDPAYWQAMRDLWLLPAVFVALFLFGRRWWRLSGVIGLLALFASSLWLATMEPWWRV